MVIKVIFKVPKHHQKAVLCPQRNKMPSVEVFIVSSMVIMSANMAIFP